MRNNRIYSMQKSVFLLWVTLCAICSYGQESQTEYNFLRVPVSAHAAATGGDNISLIEDDEALIFNNPALLTSVNDKTIFLSYMNYMAGANMAGAAFNKILRERASVALSAQYVDYGKMKQTDENNTLLGDFSAKDIALSGYFSYLLTDRLSGGIAAKFITSSIGSYHSFAVGVDLGLNYYDSEHEWSVSLVGKNLGGQLKAYNDNYEKMPIEVQAGVSKRITHTPFRLTATLVDLTHWNYKALYHLAAGADIIITDNIWIGLGYNFRRANEMTIAGKDDGGSSHLAGFSIGAGLNLERFKLNLAYGKYHVSSNAFFVNLAYSL